MYHSFPSHHILAYLPLSSFVPPPPKFKCKDQSSLLNGKAEPAGLEGGRAAGCDTRSGCSVPGVVMCAFLGSESNSFHPIPQRLYDSKEHWCRKSAPRKNMPEGTHHPFSVLRVVATPLYPQCNWRIAATKLSQSLPWWIAAHRSTESKLAVLTLRIPADMVAGE